MGRLLQFPTTVGFIRHYRNILHFHFRHFSRTIEKFATSDVRPNLSMGSEYQEVAEKGMAAYRAPSLTQPHKARRAIRDTYEGKIKPLI